MLGGPDFTGPGGEPRIVYSSCVRRCVDDDKEDELVHVRLDGHDREQIRLLHLQEVALPTYAR